MNWDLTKLYPDFDSPEFARDVDDLKALSDRLLDDVRAMRVDAEALEGVIRAYQRVMALAVNTHTYAQLTLAADANCAPAMNAVVRLKPILNRLSEIRSALSARLAGAGSLDDIIAASPLLREHAYLLRTLQRDAAHVIDPALEPVALRMQLTGGAAWEQLRDQLDGNHTVAYTLGGKTTRMPLSAVRGMAYSPDAATRKAAYEAELAAYPKIEIPMAACLNGIKGEALTMIGLKRYASVLDMSLDEARMDRATLDALTQAMWESLPMFRRYFRLKARLLGYEGGLKFYDLFAPVGSMAANYTPEDARAILVRELGAFSPRMADMIDRAYDGRWIDMYPREGKTGGAFCEGVHPLGISYVLTNFDGSYASVSTLAHELGHAYQNECMRQESILLADCPMPLAETASIFNETLLAQRMLQTADRDARIAMLDQQLSDAAQVIVDILSRFLFEAEVIKRREEGAPTAAELCAIMTDAQKKTYGDGLDPECLHPYMWACKSHYYSPDIHFYNFPYAFGQLFAVGVYRLYLKRGADFLPVYEGLLRDAGKGDVRDVAASVGIDVANVRFWRDSIGFFADMLAELEAMTA